MSDSGEEEYEPGGGFLYETPLVLPGIIIRSSHDYILNIELVHAAYAEYGLDEEQIEMLDEDCGPEGDVDGAYGSVQYLASLGRGDLLVGKEQMAEGLALLAADTDPNGLCLGDNIQDMRGLIEAFSLDDLAPRKEYDGLNVPQYPDPPRAQVEVRSGLLPPRPTHVQEYQGQMVGILLTSYRSRTPYSLRSSSRWGPVLAGKLPEGCSLGKESHFDMVGHTGHGAGLTPSIGYTTSSLASLESEEDVVMRSNSRPRGGCVYAVMERGNMINIGSHSYILSSDLYQQCHLGNAHIALAELFAAVAGEGLACATGSHSLHQMVSAVLSNAIQPDQGTPPVSVERHGADITFWTTRQLECIELDITTNEGIHQKMSHRKKQAVLSKYALASIFITTLPEEPARAFACAVACCLAVEHSTYYGQPELCELSQDLQVQYRISNIVNRMSQKTIMALSEMSYHAVIAESLVDAAKLDPFAPGKGYKEKAQVLLLAIQKLKCKDMYAVPPYPTGTITGFTGKARNLDVLDVSIHLPANAMLRENITKTIQPEDNDLFLKLFPATGRFPVAEVRETCRILADRFLGIDGATHKGPIQNPDNDLPDADLWEAASEIYAMSAVAQFAELRADLVRAIDQNPTGNPKIWRSAVVYKEKVVVFYRVRDVINDARGYRVDWFAIAPFPAIGAVRIDSAADTPTYLWPRQRLRSQEMELAAMTPRRLKLTLFSMLSMSRATGATLKEIQVAWQKLAITATSSTWASGANFITCRHLSSSLSAPSPPFDAMAKKFKPPQTMACLLYLESLTAALRSWHERDQYQSRCAILGLPRAFSQLEAYWQVWVPDELADTTKHFTDCVLALYSEYSELHETSQARINDLLSQYEIVTRASISYHAIRASVRASCSIDTGGKFGWSVFGSMASAHALVLQGSPKNFDKSFSRGGKARNITSHLTVRHSGRINSRGDLEKGTVAQMILRQGLDPYLSTLEPAARFFYAKRPYFMNHPKNGELKDREISITDPDSRIMLNDAEFICGEYGRTTKIDMLKRPDKDAFFYRISSQALLTGGVIQASDASRFAAMMSNIAVGITCSVLAAHGGSTHLLSSASVYTRLASRRMVIDTCVLREITKRLAQDRDIKEKTLLVNAQKWIAGMPKIGMNGADVLREYCTAAHTGQGMSHVGMSLEHGGALLLSIAAAKQAQIIIAGREALVEGIPLVTSDDSTIVAGMADHESSDVFSRAERQRACHMFLRVQRACREIALRSVSVMPNLSKEKSSGTAGEFNSQDNGIGVSCPILGFREMVCQLTRPSSMSLINDYLDAHAYGRSLAMCGMGLTTACYAQRLKIDAVEQRWALKEDEKAMLQQAPIIPISLTVGADLASIVTSAASLLPPGMRASLMQMASAYHAERTTTDINTKDMAFTVLGHVKLSMKKQHRKAIADIEEKIRELDARDMVHQSLMLRQALDQTISSARTRNAGRIAQRVRTKVIMPGECLGHAFQKAPILESTLTWLDYLNTAYTKYPASPQTKTLANTYGTLVVAAKPSRLRFPEPCTRHKSKNPYAKKPVFILDIYGKTPFGKHVISRAGATLISAYGPEHREEMSNYNAIKAYRRIPEHNLYGGRLPLSWFSKTSCVLVSQACDDHVEIAADILQYWGYTNEDSINFLKDVEQDNPNMPVLALNYASGGRAHFHTIYKGTPYSASMDFDPVSHAPFQTFQARARGGQAVILALQDYGTDRQWYGSGPTAQEIKAFQFDPTTDFRNNFIEATWSKLERDTFVQMPMAACVQDRADGRYLYVIDPRLRKRAPQAWIPYNRGKFITAMATGGFWYTALSGCCVRAYLKGYTGVENCWTGTILGWRMTRQQEPDYHWHPPDHGTVRTLAVIGGVDTDEHISVLNPSKYANAHCYVDKSGIHAVDEVHFLAENLTNLNLIRGANAGELLFNHAQGKAQFIDSELPDLGAFRPLSTPDECFEELYRSTHEVEFSIFDLGSSA